MTRTLRRGAVALLLFALPACAPAGSGPGSPGGNGSSSPGGAERVSSSGPAGSRVVLSRSGGIAGVDDTITVAPDGAWTRTDRAGQRRSGRLSDRQRDRLRALAADPALMRESTRTDAATRCRDAFRYALTVDSAQVRYVDCPSDGPLPATAVSIVELLTASTSY